MKFAVLAGTHQRENEFSHSVADKLITELNLKKTDELLDEYKTRRAEIYDSEKIAVAKIHPIRELPREFFETLHRHALEHYVNRKLVDIIGKSAPALMVEDFNMNPEWTTVHDEILQKTAPEYFIDLHSAHIRTEGIDGTTMQINVFSDESKREYFKNIKNKYTEKQQGHKIIEGHYEDYEANNNKFAIENLTEENNTKNLLKKEISGQLLRFGREGTISFLSEKEIKDINIPEYIKRNVHRLFWNNIELDKKITHNDKIYAQKYSEWWFMNLRDKITPYNKVHFEAVHWGEKNQKLIVNFITAYLL